MRRSVVSVLALFSFAVLLTDVTDASDEVSREISYLQSPDPRNRVVAAFHIHEMGEKAAPAIPFLISLLSDQSNTTVPIPGRIKKLLHDAAHLEHLPDYSFGVRHMTVAQSVEIALSGIGRESIGPLKAALSNDDEKIRCGAAVALGRLQAPGVLASLIDGFERETAYLKWKFLRGLGYLGDPGALPKLAAYGKDNDPVVRVNSAWAMGRIKDPGARPALTALLGDDETYVRERAEESIRMIGDDRAYDEIAAGLESSDWRERCYSVFVAGERSGSEYVNLLIKALRDDHRKVKMSALRILMKLRDPAASDELFKLAEPGFFAFLSRGGMEVRYTALEVLAKTGDGRAAEPILALTKDMVFRQRFLGIAEMILRITDSRAERDLLRGLKEGDSLTSAIAALGLARIGVGEGVEATVKYITAGSPETRRAAIYGAGHLGGAAFVPSLIKCLHDEDEKVRIQAIQSLGEMKAREAVKALTPLLTESEGTIGENAAMALGSIGTAEASRALVEALQYAKGEVRMRAVKALKVLRDPNAVEPLIELLLKTQLENVHPALLVVPMDVVETLGELRDPRSVDPLITTLRRSPYWLKDLSGHALQKTTGQDFGIDDIKWRKWWEVNRSH